MNILFNWTPNSNFWISFWIEFSKKKGFWIIFWIEYSWYHFWWKAPFFVNFGHFLGNLWALFLFDQYQWFPDYSIESSFELNEQIFFWIESWIKQYWIVYWMNHFLAKFKHWIESDRVSKTPMCYCVLSTTVWLVISCQI